MVVSSIKISVHTPDDFNIKAEKVYLI